MGQYHLYYLRDGELVGADDIDAADEQEAVRIARTKGEGRVVEVWNAHSRIRILAPDSARSLP